jgi:hypothetical protein
MSATRIISQRTDPNTNGRLARRMNVEYLGHPMMFWVELKRRVDERPDTLGYDRLLQEVVDLRGKVSFYESRVNEMARHASGKGASND